MKQFILIITSLLIFGCKEDLKKRKLVEAFEDMRKIPSKIISVEKKGNYEIAYQKEKNISERFNYPNNFSIGKLNKSKTDFKYVTHVYNISPIEQFEYISKILETYESDSTYIAAIVKEENKLKANIYRQKTNKEFIMWKWIVSDSEKLNFTTKQIMNEHLFEK